MQQLRLVFAIMLMASLVPLSVFAQETTEGTLPPALPFAEAYTLIQSQYPDDEILEIYLIEETGYWEFELDEAGELYLSSEDSTIITEEEYDERFPDDDMDDDFDDDDDNEDFDESNTPEINISLEDAINATLTVYPNAAVVSIELEEGYGGVYVWDIELSNGREVDVSTESGNILSFGWMDDDDDVEPNTSYDDEDYDEDDRDDDDDGNEDDRDDDDDNDDDDDDE